MMALYDMAIVYSQHVRDAVRHKRLSFPLTILTTRDKTPHIPQHLIPLSTGHQLFQLLHATVFPQKNSTCM